MGIEYVLGAFVVIASIVGIVKVISMDVEPDVRRKGGGAQPLTDVGPKPGLKPGQSLCNIRAARPRVRPSARRMRQGGTAMALRRRDYDTDLLFLEDLNKALDHDEHYYGLCDLVQSPFLNDAIDYIGSEFENYAMTEEELL